MGDLLRLFVGLRVGGPARDALAREAGRLARADDALRATHEHDLHLTLAFLGDTPRGRLADLGRALEPVARAHAPLDVRYVGLGAFPSARAPRVLWAGVEAAAPGALTRLARDVARALEPLGVPPEERAFHAHVTLARVRRGKRVAPCTLERLRVGAGEGFGGDRLSVLKIMVSLADPMGYAYNDLTDLPLLGAP